ncbi:histidine phosphatase family protein [Opitutus sp. ER46]|uniref:histidine phosphatase family protein n=1 Tax=Opitutus sp. ER46 TaxID=2161864 RepID=UPI000D306E34|nr:histidine phosphatase family protein [Opitutus sp. ER46]PTX97747.1 hypothetical protein DB354_05565 [Opitutus sp. ER46]
MQTILYWVRHAQSLPLPTVTDEERTLSPRGYEQAKEMVPVLQALGADRIYTSPFRRCRETLQPFAAAARLPLLEHAGLRERCFGTAWIDDFRDIWRQSWADFSYAVPGGENSLVCRDRVAAAAAELVRRHPGETLVLGSHGNAIALFLSSITPGYGIEAAGAVRTPDLLRVVHDGQRFTWDQSFVPGAAFDAIATDFRLTPGIKA